MLKFRMFKEELYSSEVGAYISYGIRAFERNGRKWRLVDTVSDISLRRRKVKGIVKKCNKYKLSIDILRDFIEEQL